MVSCSVVMLSCFKVSDDKYCVMMLHKQAGSKSLTVSIVS